MEEIKVGEYIRTKYGYIRKVDRINYLDEIIVDDMVENEFEDKNWFVQFKDVVKHSSNIIDLIEVGDYVNGYKVLDVMENLNTGEINLEMPMDYTNKELGDCTIYNKNIKSICTKEQFANAEYRLEE